MIYGAVALRIGSGQSGMTFLQIVILLQLLV
jgi:hypothetical protein